MNWSIEVYDKDRKRIAILEQAYNIGYTKEKDKLSEAEFTLRIDDEKNIHCKPFNYIKLYENGRYIDMFRIMPLEMTKDAATKEIHYFCEHVLGRLLDTSLFGYHEIGGIGTHTVTILNYLLNRQSDWKLGNCDFQRQFQYSWENENLLSALFSIPRPFDENYSFTWDTTVYPWVINLVRPSDEVKAYLRYERNMKGIKKREDGSVVCTRLYALGYGEGINQLGITNANPTRLPYIDADTIDEYGVIEKIWCDRRYQIEDNLYQAAYAKLERIKQPKITYEIEAAELYAITGIPIDKFDEGDVIRVIDEETGIDVTTRIVRKSKTGIESDYISASIQVSSDGSAASGLTDLYERAKINETNSQGATNINNYNYYGNCDTSYPAKIRFRIPDEAVNINKVELSFQADAFRAFSKAIRGGGGTSSTTNSGGGTSSTTSSGGSTSTSTQNGGASSQSSSSGGGTNTSTQNGGAAVVSSIYQGMQGFNPVSNVSTNSGHTHLLPNFGMRGDVPSHSHNVTIPNHDHRIDIPSHVHSFTVPSHSHGFAVDSHSHSITLNNHVHEIEYGIYEGPTASRFTVRVDGALANLTTAADSFDIVQYLRKDGGGRIARGWHEVLISPNSLCMINADVMVQVFVNSRGGGNF